LAERSRGKPNARTAALARDRSKGWEVEDAEREGEGAPRLDPLSSGHTMRSGAHTLRIPSGKAVG